MTDWKDFPGRSGPDRIFAIGDVHGQGAALRHALDRIRAREDRSTPAHLIFTGDIIDRGPDNLGAIAAFLDAKQLAGVDRVTFLVGNHELMLLEAIRDPHMGMNLWAQNGGFALIDEVDPQAIARSVTDVAKVLKDALPEFVAAIDAARDNLRIDDILFVHGGVSPHHDMGEFLSQPRDKPSSMDEHWAWIREPFLEHPGRWNDEPDLVIVHGHTPHHGGARITSEEAGDYLDLVAPFRRICIDAGAAEMDQVAVLEMNDGAYRFDIVHAPEPDVEICPSAYAPDA